MNFITFPVDATNIFPASNMTNGGQLLTEWNLRSRETVSTDSAIKYEVGPSYVHGEDDFKVTLLQDGSVVLSNYILQIHEGRGVINGHYVETLTPMKIDLVEANAKLSDQSRPLLKGNLAIGIRTFYATEATVAGSILTQDENDMLLGVQLVVLPVEEMITPSDSPEDPNAVTCDVVLATFTFLNNSVTNIKNLKTKLQYLTTDRLKYMDDFTPENYVRKTGLNSKKMYAFAGKGTDPDTGYDTWEDVTDSMIIWDREPVETTNKNLANLVRQASFVVQGAPGSGDILPPYSVNLILPHKQVYGMKLNPSGSEEVDGYYAPRIISLPNADYDKGTGGVVSFNYTSHIKSIERRLQDFQHNVKGKQVYYMDTRTVTTPLPPINDNWDPGDYVLVKNDEYFLGGADATMSAPATMYCVLPGQVREKTTGLLYITSVSGDSSNPDPELPDYILGCELGYMEWYASAGQPLPGRDNDNPAGFPDFYGPDDVVRGVPRISGSHQFEDYFRLRYYEEDTTGTYPFKDYLYGVRAVYPGTKIWSDPILVTGSVSLATESTIGGFYNASQDATDYGYVMLDDSGHLRLIDYDLLRSGTLAYQLSEDIELPSGLDIPDIQTYLDEYVNRRIAFPKDSDLSAIPSVINVEITIPATEDGGTLEINGIDSRFDTAVCLVLKGDAGNNVTINIRDCEKLMIDGSYLQGSTISSGDESLSPIINIYRTNLRYDSDLFNYIRNCPRSSSVYGSFTGFQDLSIWYQRLTSSDPSLTVDGMTIGQIDSYIISTDINYWSELNAPTAELNDNVYRVALKSITFSNEGDIVGCEILVANSSTDNIVVGDKIVVGDVVLPQGSALQYPVACLTKILKVSGSFTNAYYSDTKWYVTDNNFTFLSGTFNPLTNSVNITGQIAFHSVTSLVSADIGQTVIAGWETDTYHIFQGGAIN